ncbi:Rieske 2Fe-2S domain-containing protein [Devosia sp.]|uniref:Rieske 2Fe-2S domain-containing protein n=1 Tax=Devosia sp. TaxID=1871048 RepID=UPI003A9161E3
MSNFEGWHPIAASGDLPFRHVFHGQLAGRELAVWRADDGNVNVWENRCLHRGVRLSIGINEGTELKCQYHGWRYANRSAGCTYIPAHPADAPARRITNRTYPVTEQFGLVWAAVTPVTAFAPPLAGSDWFALRPIPVNAPPDLVLQHLRAAADGEVTDIGPEALQLTLQGAGGEETAIFVQPVDSDRAVIRGLVAGKPQDEVATLRLFNRLLTDLRTKIETAAAAQASPEPIVPTYEPVSLELSSMPDLRVGQQATLRVRLARRFAVAEDITGLELAALEGHLPTFQPGAHIDLHLPNGLVRQYSVTNGPGEQLSYVIAVKREPDSRGGSTAIADTLREGDVLAISEPRNNFPLRRDALHTTLIAGGIGITPLLSMARALHGSHLPFDFHVFARSEAHLAFRDVLTGFGERTHPHLGLSVAETEAEVAAALGAYSFARHVYVCGPGPMLELVRATAARLGWPDEAVHFEYFKNTRPIDDRSSFTVELARSALTLEVPGGKSILDVMRENGIDAPSSCEQGACGTCLTTVLEGVPDHQDVYLNETEKQANRTMLTCVSRAKSARLVLDI